MKRQEVINKLLDLDGSDFQRICDSYFRTNGYPNLVSFGLTVKGNKTKKGTPDSHVLDADGQYIFFEYSTEQGNIGGKLDNDIKSCLELLKKANSDEANKKITCKKIIFVATSNNLDSVSLNNNAVKCREVGIELKTFCLNEFCDLLMKNGKKVIEEELHINTYTSPVCSLTDFVNRTTVNYGCDFTKTMFGREDDLEKIKEKINLCDAVIIAGDSGCGKTKLAIEFLKSYTKNGIIVQNRIGDIPHDLMLETEKNAEYCILFDDANGISQFKYCLEDLINSKKKIKLIITVRNYAKDNVIEIISNFKISYDVISINALPNNQIEKIISNNYGILNPNYQERILKISNGNARLAIIASEKTLQNDDGLIWKDSASLLNSYFTDILQNNSVVNTEDYKKLLGILSILKKIDLDDRFLIDKISSIIGIKSEEIVSKFYELYNQEIADIYLDRVIKVEDQCLQDYFVYDAIVKSRIISLKVVVSEFFSLRRKEVIESINTLINVYTSAKGNDFIKNEIISLWEELENNNKITNDFILAFSAVDSLKALKWCKENIFIGKHKIQDYSKVDDSKFSYRNEYLDILKHLFYIGNDNESLSLIFDSLSYAELYSDAYSVIKELTEFEIEDFEIKFLRQLKIVEVLKYYKVEKWFSDVAILICNALLKFNFTIMKSNKGNSFEMCHLIINDKICGCKELRNEVWSLLNDVDSKKVFKVICDYFSDYPNDADELFSNDLVNIENILNKNIFDKRHEMIIYAKSINVFCSKKITWKYMETKMSNKKELIYLLFNPKDEEIGYLDRKSKWENSIEIKSKNSDFNESKFLLEESLALHKIRKECKISEFINNYLCFCNKETIEWVLSKFDVFVIEFGTNIFYSLSQRIFENNNYFQFINIVENQYYKNELLAAALYSKRIPNSLRKETLNNLLRIEKATESYNPIINRRIDVLYEFLSAEEFIDLIDIINNMYETNKTLCESYYSLLFNPYAFSSSLLCNIFEKNISIIESSYLNYLKSGLLDYEASEYYFDICSLDFEWFAKSLDDIVFGEFSSRALSLIWKQEKWFDYATILFNYLYSKAKDELKYRFDFASYFGLGMHSEFKDDEKILNWAKNMYEGNDSDKIIYVSKIVAETSKKCVAEYFSFLIDKGISLEIFKGLHDDPLVTTYSGSHVPQIERRIKFWQDVLNGIQDKFKSRELISFIDEKIQRLNDSIKETKIQENLRENI